MASLFEFQEQTEELSILLVPAGFFLLFLVFIPCCTGFSHKRGGGVCVWRQLGAVGIDPISSNTISNSSSGSRSSNGGGCVCGAGSAGGRNTSWEKLTATLTNTPAQLFDRWRWRSQYFAHRLPAPAVSSWRIKEAWETVASSWVLPLFLLFYLLWDFCSITTSEEFIQNDSPQLVAVVRWGNKDYLCSTNRSNYSERNTVE